MKKFSKALLVMGMSSLMSINVFAFTFADVSTEHWAYKSISYMHEKGYMTVNSEGNFLPNTRVSYFNIAELLAKAAGYQDENIVKTMDEAFKLQIRENYANWAPYITAYDERYTVWETTANEEIAYLLGKGILKQEDLSKFVGKTADGQEAKRVLTKEDLSVYLVRLLGKEKEAIASYTKTSFNDQDQIKEANRPHIAYLNGLNIVNGDTQGNFGASTGVVRSVCAKMVADVLQYKETLPTTPTGSTQEAQDGSKRTGIVSRITPKSANEYFILIDQNGTTNWATIRENTLFLNEDSEPLTLSDITVGTRVTAYIVKEDGTEYVSKLYKANAQENIPAEEEDTSSTPEVVTRSFKAEVVRVGAKDTITLVEDGKTKVYGVDADASILWDGSSKTLDQIPTDAILQVYTENDVITRLTVLEIKETEEKGEFIKFVARRDTYGVTVSQNNVEKEIEVEKDVKVTRNNRTSDMEALSVGDALTFVIEEDEIVEIVAESEEQVVKGRISSILLGLTPQITIQTNNETLTYVLATTTEIYNEQTRSKMNLRDLQIGSTVEVEASSRQASYLSVEKIPSVLSYKGVIQEVQNGGQTLYVLVEYDMLTGETMIEKAINVPIETLVLLDDKASRRSLLEEDMEVLVLFDYADTTEPTKVMVINK